jgi:hypothetical protein
MLAAAAAVTVLLTAVVREKLRTKPVAWQLPTTSQCSTCPAMLSLLTATALLMMHRASCQPSLRPAAAAPQTDRAAVKTAAAAAAAMKTQMREVTPLMTAAAAAAAIVTPAAAAVTLPVRVTEVIMRGQVAALRLPLPLLLLLLLLRHQLPCRSPLCQPIAAATRW